MNRERLSQINFTILMPPEKRDPFISLEVAQLTLESGLVDLEMVMENRFGLMEHVMKVTGEIIERMVRENLFILMEMFMKVSGLMTKLMAMEYMFMLMVLAIKAIGKTTYNMEKERKLGQMDQFTKENILLEKSMEEVFIAGMTDHATMANGKKIKLKGWEHIHGWMVENILENG